MPMIKDQTLDILRRLIAFNTISSRSNLACIAYIEDYFHTLKIPCHVDYNPQGNKANLIARIGPAVAGGIVFSGHSDVVPVAGQPWETDPFTLVEKNQKLYGRGTADMKSFLAVMLALAPQLSTINLKKPVYMVFSYDEEVGCQGIPSLLQYMQTHIPKPALAIIGEPTEMALVASHKGICVMKTTVTGIAGHSSRIHEGINAIAVASNVMQALLKKQKALEKQPCLEFSPPYSTINIGMIQGGLAVNIIPESCYFTWDIRMLPGKDVTTCIKDIEQNCQDILIHYPGATIIHKILHQAPPLQGKVNNDYHAMLLHALGSNTLNHVSFTTEAGIFEQYDIPAVVCGPGSIKQAHKANEFIEPIQIDRCIKFMLDITTSFLT